MKSFYVKAIKKLVTFKLKTNNMLKPIITPILKFILLWIVLPVIALWFTLVLFFFWCLYFLWNWSYAIHVIKWAWKEHPHMFTDSEFAIEWFMFIFDILPDSNSYQKTKCERAYQDDIDTKRQHKAAQALAKRKQDKRESINAHNS